MSGLFKSSVIKGNKITDFAETTATVGVVIPRIFGRAPTDGNVIFAPLPPKEHKTVKRQGKGGVKQENITYTLSYAIAFCKGPIYGYWWIKRGGKVVLTSDPAAPIEDQAYAAKWLQKATLYYGTLDQLPDSTIESYRGTGRVSGFHGLAYIVVEDDDVTENGGAVPPYSAVPMGSPGEVYFTSHPYAQAMYDNTVAGLRPRGGEMRSVVVKGKFAEKGISAFAPSGGELKTWIPPYIEDDVVTGFVSSGGRHDFPPLGRFADSTTSAFAPSGGELFNPPLGRFYDAAETGLEPTGGELSGTPSPPDGEENLVLKIVPGGSAGVYSFMDESPLARTISNTAGIVSIANADAPGGMSLTGFEDGRQMLYTPKVSADDMRAGPFQIDFGWENPNPLYATGFEHTVLGLVTPAYSLPYEWAVTVCPTYIAFYHGSRGNNQSVVRFFFPGGVDLSNPTYYGQRYQFRIGRDAAGDWGAWIDGVRCPQYQYAPLSISLSFGSVTTGTYNNPIDFGANAFDYMRVGQLFTYVGGTSVRYLDNIEYRVGECADVSIDYTP